MARLEARSVVPRPEPTPAADLFRAVREHLPLVVQTRQIDVRVNRDCPDVFVDPSRGVVIVKLSANPLYGTSKGEETNKDVENIDAIRAIAGQFN